MFTPNWKTAGYKSIQHARMGILELLMNSPSCSGVDGKLLMSGLDNRGWLEIIPKRKKTKDEV